MTDLLEILKKNGTDLANSASACAGVPVNLILRVDEQQAGSFNGTRGDGSPLIVEVDASAIAGVRNNDVLPSAIAGLVAQALGRKLFPATEQYQTAHEGNCARLFSVLDGEQNDRLLAARFPDFGGSAQTLKSLTIRDAAKAIEMPSFVSFLAESEERTTTEYDRRLSLFNYHLRRGILLTGEGGNSDAATALSLVPANLKDLSKAELLTLALKIQQVLASGIEFPKPAEVKPRIERKSLPVRTFVPLEKEPKEPETEKKSGTPVRKLLKSNKWRIALSAFVLLWLGILYRFGSTEIWGTIFWVATWAAGAFAAAFSTREFLKKRNVPNYGAKTLLITVGLLAVALLLRFANKHALVDVALVAALALLAWGIFKSPNIVKVVLACIGVLGLVTLVVIALIKLGKTVILVALIIALVGLVIAGIRWFAGPKNRVMRARIAEAWSRLVTVCISLPKGGWRRAIWLRSIFRGIGGFFGAIWDFIVKGIVYLFALFINLFMSGLEFSIVRVFLIAVFPAAVIFAVLSGVFFFHDVPWQLIALQFVPLPIIAAVVWWKRKAILKFLLQEIEPTDLGRLELLDGTYVDKSTVDFEVIDEVEPVYPDQSVVGTFQSDRQGADALRAELKKLGQVARDRDEQHEGDDIEDPERLLEGHTDIFVDEQKKEGADVHVEIGLDISDSQLAASKTAKEGEKFRRGMRFCLALDSALAGIKGLSAQFWGYNGKTIYDCGRAGEARVSGLKPQGGNNEAAMLHHMAQSAGKVRKSVKILLLVCDGLPEDCSWGAINNLATGLERQGFIPVMVATDLVEEPAMQYVVDLSTSSLEDAVSDLIDIVTSAAKSR